VVAPGKAVLLKVDREQWQALAAVCAAPAFYNSQSSVPLIFDDGKGQNDVAIEHDTMSVKDFGSDASAATAKIALKFWKESGTRVCRRRIRTSAVDRSERCCCGCARSGKSGMPRR